MTKHPVGYPGVSPASLAGSVLIVPMEPLLCLHTGSLDSEVLASGYLATVLQNVRSLLVKHSVMAS